MTSRVTLEINGRSENHVVEPRTSLADLLRGECQLNGTHLGCEHGVCGACTVVLDGAPARSCITYAVQADGGAVRTIEGFDDDPVMGDLREAFKRHHALQCGFCTPGMLITARDIVRRLDRPDEKRVREELGGNLCRCTGYVGIVEAVMEVAARARREEPVASLAKAARPVDKPVRGPTPATAMPLAGNDLVRINESIALPYDPDRVWTALGDLERTARCLPGAEVTAIEGNVVRARLRIRLGPIASRFEVEATQERDEAQRRGALTGQGRDALTASRARGRLDFAVSASDGGSRLDVALAFSLQGALAQFSRGALVQDLARQLIAQFAANLGAQIEGRAPAAPVAEMRAGGMLLAALRRWLRRLLGRG
jgi:aerobic carbon-monoxide dehydrogenase small subunit